MRMVYARWKAWRDRRQAERCAADRHRFRSVSPDRRQCIGCGRWWRGYGE